MGAYINPTNESKEDFLKREGIMLVSPLEEFDKNPGHLAVCWINNGPFTAAAIAFNQREIYEFTRPDPRPKQWFWVPIDKSYEVSAELEAYRPRKEKS